MKIIINKTIGGFAISKVAAEHMAANGSEKAKLELETSANGWFGYGYTGCCDDDFGYDRSDPLLVQAVEELGNAANMPSSVLVIEEIPDDVKWYITEEHGYESLEWSYRPLKIYRVEFEPLYPVGGCLVLAAIDQEQAEELAVKTLSRDGIIKFVVNEVTPTEPGIIEYLSGNY